MLRRLYTAMRGSARFHAREPAGAEGDAADGERRASVAAVRSRSAFLLCAWVAIASLARPALVAADAGPAVRLPPGTRADAAGGFVSGRGLRDTTDFLARELAARGIATRQIGPYRVRGVELTRFVSETPSTPWLAIHALRAGGKTLIFFVPRPKA